MRPFLIFLLASPVLASDSQPPTAARQAVARALPAELSARAMSGDLAGTLSALPREQREAALRSLREKQGALGEDPAVLAQLGSAYLGLGSGPEALATAERVLARDPRNPDALGVKARALVARGDKAAARAALAQIPSGHPQAALVLSAIQLAPGDAARASSAAAAPAGPARQLQAFERRISGLLRHRNRSNELQSTLSDARGVSVEELNRAGIQFRMADAGQRDAVVMKEEGDQFVISLRPDALESSEARAAAHVANGVRQAQTDRDHPYVGWALRIARGWRSGGQVHRELAPDDIVTNPGNPSDRDLMLQRRLLEMKERRITRGEVLPPGPDGGHLSLANSQAARLETEGLFEYFIRSARSHLAE